jgi:hypothetical protein
VSVDNHLKLTTKDENSTSDIVTANSQFSSNGSDTLSETLPEPLLQPFGDWNRNGEAEIVVRKSDKTLLDNVSGPLSEPLSPSSTIKVGQLTDNANCQTLLVSCMAKEKDALPNTHFAVQDSDSSSQILEAAAFHDQDSI